MIRYSERNLLKWLLQGNLCCVERPGRPQGSAPTKTRTRLKGADLCKGGPLRSPWQVIETVSASHSTPFIAIIILGLATLLFPFAHAFAHASATGNGRIGGQLLNGSHKNASVVGQRVTLQMSQDGSARDIANTTTDAHGGYTFANLATDSLISYALYINFQGAQYLSDVITLDKKPVQQANLTIYDATTNSKNLAILRSNVLVQEPNAKNSTFSVSESFAFRNLSLQSFVGSLDASQGKPNALFFSLPKNARNVRLDTGFTGYKALQITGGFATNAAVLPGDSAFSLSFEVPYTASVYDFTYEAMYPTVDLSFLVAPSIHANSASLNPQGIITADQHSYQQFKGNQLLTNQQVHVGFEGLTTAASSSSPIDLKYVWLIVGVLILLAIITVASALSRLQDGKKKGRKAGKPASKGYHEEKKSSRGTAPGHTERKQELMHELLELDKAYEAGRLSKSAYQERRARTKARLRTLMSEQEVSRR